MGSFCVSFTIGLLNVLYMFIEVVEKWILQFKASGMKFKQINVLRVKLFITITEKLRFK